MKKEEISEKLTLAMALSADLWNTFLEIPEFYKHPQDAIEMNRDIHDIQNRLFSIAIKNKIPYSDFEK